MSDNKHPLENPEVSRQYALETVLFDTLLDCQMIFIDLGLIGQISETTLNRLRTRVMHWRENMPLYLQDPKWEETGGAL